jgi:hypothetical protein
MSRTGFRGTWRNTDASSRSVTTLAFEADEARVHAWAAGPGREGVVALGSGAIELFGGIADASPLAFTARLPGAGQGEVLLQGNLNRGLMILATYQWISGDSVLAGRFSREFHARRESGFVAPTSIVPPEPAAASSVSASVDLREFLGRWVNTNPGGDLRTLAIEPSESRLCLHVVGSDRRLPARWPAGESSLFAYLDESGHETLLLLGRFELPEGRSDLQIKVVTGTAVVAGFHARDDGRSWFTREFMRLG